jgi:hypothetical protein
MGSTPVTGSNLKALRDAPLSFLDFLYKSALIHPILGCLINTIPSIHRILGLVCKGGNGIPHSRDIKGWL